MVVVVAETVPVPAAVVKEPSHALIRMLMNKEHRVHCHAHHTPDVFKTSCEARSGKRRQADLHGTHSRDVGVDLLLLRLLTQAPSGYRCCGAAAAAAAAAGSGGCPAAAAAAAAGSGGCCAAAAAAATGGGGCPAAAAAAGATATHWAVCKVDSTVVPKREHVLQQAKCIVNTFTYMIDKAR